MKRIGIFLLLAQTLIISTVILASSTLVSNQKQFLGNLTQVNAVSETDLYTLVNLDMEWKYDTGNDVVSVDMSADGQYIVSGNDPGSNMTFFNRSGYLFHYNNTGSAVPTVSISADGQYCVIGDLNDNVSLFNRTKFLDYYTTLGTINTVSISGDGLYFTAGDADKVYLFNRAGDIINYMWNYTVGSFVDPTVAISVDGRYIISGDSDNNVTLFNQTGYLDYYNTGSTVNSVAISDNGLYLVAGCGVNITLFSTSNDVLNFLGFYNTGSNVASVAISTDGLYIAAGNDVGDVFLFRRDGTKLMEYNVGDNVYDVAISADGKYVVSGDAAYNVTLFNRNGYIWRYAAVDRFTSVAISDDNKYIVAGSEDDFVYLFNITVTAAGKQDLSALILMLQGADNQIVIIFAVLGIGIGVAIVVIIVYLKKKG